MSWITLVADERGSVPGQISSGNEATAASKSRPSGLTFAAIPSDCPPDTPGKIARQPDLDNLSDDIAERRSSTQHSGQQRLQHWPQDLGIATRNTKEQAVINPSTLHVLFSTADEAFIGNIRSEQSHHRTHLRDQDSAIPLRSLSTPLNIKCYYN